MGIIILGPNEEEFPHTCRQWNRHGRSRAQPNDEIWSSPGPSIVQVAPSVQKWVCKLKFQLNAWRCIYFDTCNIIQSSFPKIYELSWLNLKHIVVIIILWWWQENGLERLKNNYVLKQRVELVCLYSLLYSCMWSYCGHVQLHRHYWHWIGLKIVSSS